MTGETPPAAKGVTEARDKLKLWFFRDMSDEQRLKLFSLFGLPTDEIGNTHGHQSIALKHVLASLSLPPPGEGDRPHPLAIYADSYAQMGRMGDGKVDCRSVEVDIRQNMIPVTRALTPAAPELAVKDQSLDADLFWDDENPEESYRDVEDIFDAIGEAATYLKVRRAKSLPDAWVSCVLTDEDASDWIITYHEDEESARKTVQVGRLALSSVREP